MDFRTLVQKRLRCAYVSLSPREETLVTSIIHNREGVNRVLGKDAPANASREYLYYLGVCHLRHKHSGGYTLLMSAAKADCGAAWWELSLLSDQVDTQLCCRIKAYALDCDLAITYAHSNPEEFSMDLMNLVLACQDDVDSMCLKALMKIAMQPAMKYIVEILSSEHFCRAVSVAHKDRADILALLHTLLPDVPDDSDRAYNQISRDMICHRWHLV